ncbi:MAG: MurR/RpiR family transcriptional regulator [Paracoccaceae bacterium]|nr:MurR/RpiR family transcriptional regulator [Paracoccaceae bacterium]
MPGETKAAPEDLLSRIARLGPTLHPAERRVADLVLEDMEFAVHARTTEIAARAQVSAATVTRFCRTVGCDGLRELKLDLARLLAVGDRYLHPRPVRLSNSEAMVEIISQVHRSLETLVDQVSDKDLKRLAAVIAKAKRIVIFGGGGGSSMAALEAENRFFRLGLHATACNDAQLQLMMAATLTSGEVLLVLSITGRYGPIIQAAEVGGQYGAHTISITAPDSPLSRATDDAVKFHVEEPESIFAPTPARYVLIALIDILAYEVAKLRGKTAIEAMRRIKYQLVHTRDKDDSEPLGD